jgi:hypothetical protein
MIRGSNYWYIRRTDLKNGLCMRKRYKNSDEWWCYRRRKSNLINPRTGKPFLTDDKYLHAIIVCKGDTKYTSDEKHRKAFTIVGERYTNDKDGNDLDKYLSKTNRSRA